MKQIVAYIRPKKLSIVTLALQKVEGLPGMSFSDVRGFGRDRLPKTEDIVQDLLDYIHYVRIEVLCDDDQVFEITCTMEKAVRTGRDGDGKIFVLDVCRAIQIQNGRTMEAMA
jgi:nitrogen regulatory protein PII